jgi:hypothetical protein
MSSLRDECCGEKFSQLVKDRKSRCSQFAALVERATLANSKVRFC